MSDEAPYTWAEAEAQFGAECVVAFDRDIAPQGWQAVLRVRGTDLAPELWADEEECPAASPFFPTADRTRRCRCVTWNAVRWMTRAEMKAIAARASKLEKIEWLNDQLESGRLHVERPEWRREYLGSWVDIEDDAGHTG